MGEISAYMSSYRLGKLFILTHTVYSRPILPLRSPHLTVAALSSWSAVPAATLANHAFRVVAAGHSHGGASGAAALVGVALCCPSARDPWSAEAQFLRGWPDL